jgi:hypothetical protein
MIASVLWSRFVRKHLIESHIVTIYPITCWSTDYQVIRITQIADQGRDSYIHYVIAKAPAVRPTAWNESAVVEWILNVALQNVATEDAESRVSRIIWITEIDWTTTRKAYFAG